jgi:hypothetical protein
MHSYLYTSPNSPLVDVFPDELMDAYARGTAEA